MGNDKYMPIADIEYIPFQFILIRYDFNHDFAVDKIRSPLGFCFIAFNHFAWPFVTWKRRCLNFVFNFEHFSDNIMISTTTFQCSL